MCVTCICTKTSKWAETARISRWDSNIDIAKYSHTEIHFIESLKIIISATILDIFLMHKQFTGTYWKSHAHACYIYKYDTIIKPACYVYFTQMILIYCYPIRVCILSIVQNTNLRLKLTIGRNPVLSFIFYLSIITFMIRMLRTWYDNFVNKIRYIIFLY